MATTWDATQKARVATKEKTSKNCGLPGIKSFLGQFHDDKKFEIAIYRDEACKTAIKVRFLQLSLSEPSALTDV
jgi:hypothetical protein